MKKFSVVIANRHATSISLEQEFYNELAALAKEQQISLSALITKIDAARTRTNLSSALRIYVLKSLQKKLNSR